VKLRCVVLCISDKTFKTRRPPNSCAVAVDMTNPLRALSSIDCAAERNRQIPVASRTGGTDRGNDTDRDEGFGWRIGIARIIIRDCKGEKCNAGTSSLYVWQNDVTASRDRARTRCHLDCGTADEWPARRVTNQEAKCLRGATIGHSETARIARATAISLKDAYRKLCRPCK
jgi:hypothetical protein